MDSDTAIGHLNGMVERKRNDTRPIGVFDSGVGGLTVLKALLRVLPQESYIYIGDTKNLPYGTKSPETVRELSLNIAQHLLSSDIKALVVACNTISAVSLPEIQKIAGHIPVVNVIDPTVTFALKKKQSNAIAVIATETTIKSGIYAKKLSFLGGKKMLIYSKATPAFVPLIEENPRHHPLIEEAIDFYLRELKENPRISTLILGCTHYPMIKNKIQAYLGKRFTIIDSAEPTAQAVKELLTEQQILHGKNEPTRIFFTSDAPIKAMKTARAFLGGSLTLQQLTLK